MTSQGPGEPFAPGEPLYGYQTCGVTGKCFIGLGGPYTEQLMNIADGDTAVFRYVKSEKPFAAISVEASGSGRLVVLMNGNEAGCIEIENGIQKDSEIRADAGEYELELRFTETDDLEIQKLVLK